MHFEVQPNWTHYSPSSSTCYNFVPSLTSNPLLKRSFPFSPAGPDPTHASRLNSKATSSLLPLNSGRTFQSLVADFPSRSKLFIIWPIPLKILNSQICIVLIFQVPVLPKPLANAWEMVGVSKPWRKMAMAPAFMAVVVVGLCGRRWRQWWKLASKSSPGQPPLGFHFAVPQDELLLLWKRN